MKFWHKYHPDIDAADPRFKQVSLIYSILLIMIAYFAIIGTLNITLFYAPEIAFFDYLGLVLALIIFRFVSRGGNFKVASWAVIVSIAAVLLAFVHLAEGRNYSLMWVTILPPFAFFLLGRRNGSWVSAVILLYCSWYIYQLTQQQVTANLGLGALFNFIEVATAQVFLFRFYENSRQEAYDQLQKTAITDPLTKIYNRLHLDNTLKSLIAQANRSRQAVSILLLDVDHFKAVNDKYGHLVGDKVLIRLCEVVRETVRETDAVGRWGGEEFLVICPNTDQQQAIQLGQRIIENIRAEAVENDIHITVSIGAATYSAGATDSLDRLLSSADENLYRAKRGGRNQIVGGS
jgi:diguanylate cyclase (GGDEF)-like protein